MRSKLLALGAMMALAGCDDSKPMGNVQIVAAVHQCQAAGLKAQPLYRPFSQSGAAIIAIQCQP